MKKQITTLALLIPIAFATIPMEGTIAATNRKCSIHNSVYRAIGNPDFELTFSSRLPNTTMDAVVTLKHNKRGEIQTFHVITSQGYGSSSLIDPNREGRGLNIVVFDRNLNPDRIFRNKIAPEYAFVAGLGSSDYYSNNARNREFLLGDVMWKFDRCSLSSK